MGAVIQFIGWGLMILWVLGAMGLGDFQARFQPTQPDLEKRFVCVAVNDMQRRYRCDETEFNRLTKR